MNETKYLVLTYHKDAYFFPYLKAENIIVSEPIKNKSPIMRLLFRLPLLCLLSYSFIENLKVVDKVIIYDSAYNKWIGLYLKYKKGENVYLYFWNTVKKMYPQKGDKLVRQAKRLMPVYSFDHNDCKRYGLEFKSMVYSSDVVESVHKENKALEYDVFFLGWKKDRSTQIEQLYSNIFKGKYKCLFILVGDEERTIDDSIIYTTHRIAYSEYLEFARKSKAILDIPQSGQEGLTIRNVECLFLKKKMITTNTGISKYDIYKENNIFIILKDDIEELEKFLSVEYSELNSEIIDRYDFCHWIECF